MVKAPTIQRLLGGGRGRARFRAPDVIHILPDDDASLDLIAARLARLEEGSRLIAETVKRAYGELAAAVDALREQLAQELARNGAEAEGRARRAVEAAIRPLGATLAQLTEAVEGFPHVLTAAVEDVLRHVDHAVGRALGTALRPSGSGPAGRTLRLEDGALPAIPFDLEPIDRQFGHPSEVIRVPDDPRDPWRNEERPPG